MEKKRSFSDNKVKHIVIFGSTGFTGICVTQAAVEKGFKTRAFCRDPKKLPESLRNRVEIAKGDVLNYTNVKEAIQGIDGVIIALGTRHDLNPTTIMSDGLSNIVTAMKEYKVEVISACLSAFLFFDIDSDSVPARLKELTKEHGRMYEILKRSELKYISVFPPHISSDSGTGYIVRRDKYISRKVSKYDLAEFLVDCLNMEHFYQSIIGIASRQPKKQEKAKTDEEENKSQES